MQTQGLLHTTYAGAANRIRSQRFNMYAYVWGKGRRSLCHCTQSPKTPLPRSKFWLTALEITGVGGCTPSAVRVAHGPRGPGRMRGPSRPAARWGRPGAYLVRPARRHRTTSSRAAARARPGKLRSCGSNGSSEKRPMPADTSSAVWFPRGRSGQPGVSLGAATLLLPAASLGGSPPVRAPEAGLLAALPGMSPRAPEAESQSSCTPLPRPGPAQPPPTRTAPLRDRLRPGGFWKTAPGFLGAGRRAKKRGKGLGFPDDEPLKAWRREISVQFWKWVAWVPHPLARAPQEEGPSLLPEQRWDCVRCSVAPLIS